MHVARLELTDFRSYPQVDVSIDPGVSVFVGPNGEGKTNLIEALWYLSTLGSHRVAVDAPLVRAGAARAVVRAIVVRDGRALIAEIEINPGRTNRARVNRSVLPRPRELLGVLRTVLFAPEDLALVKGDPAERRIFLDTLLVSRTPRLAGVRQDYDRVLKQRNALLKSASVLRRGGGDRAADLRTLDIWDQHLAHAGAELIAARLELVESLRPLVDKAYEAIAGVGDAIGVTYRSTLGADMLGVRERAVLEAAFNARLAESRTDELERGVSLVGPHRDELVLSIAELPAKAFASQGESWSLALALRLASFELLSDDDCPVLILDDVFAELDTERRDRLAREIASAEQILITAAVPADVPETLGGARYDVLAGEVHRVR